MAFVVSFDLPMRYLAILSALIGSLLSLPSSAAVYPGDMEVVGAMTRQVTGPNDTLVELARRYDLGFGEIATANPDLDPFVPGAGKSVTIPTAWIVPEAIVTGTIVINLSEMRLYYLFESNKSRLLATFPIGIGSEGAETPLGNYFVIGKETDPDWHVPPSIKTEKPDLPAVVPAGPDNPLGSHALRLSSWSVLIHGTNKPWGVGRRVSHGCIRLYPEDIPRLYQMVPVGTKVSIVREPVKVGIKGEEVYVEIHQDDEAGLDYLEEATRLLVKKGIFGRVAPLKLFQAIKDRRGSPVVISH
jgi:L,D-transpeptidase ErfK/SrfK